MESVSITKDDRARRTETGQSIRPRHAPIELLVAGIARTARLPGPEVVISARSGRRAPGHILERARAFADVGKIQVDLHHPPIFRIAMPALRSDAAADIAWDRVPEIGV